MVYLSANGEVIGQFEERDLPSSLAAGKVPPDSFFWREGMPEWKPLRELVLPPRPVRATPAPTPPAKSEASLAAGPFAPGVAHREGREPVLKPIKPAITPKNPFVSRALKDPRNHEASAVEEEHHAAPADPGEKKPSLPVKAAAPVRKVFLPRAKELASPPEVAPANEDVIPATPHPAMDAYSPAPAKTPLPLARKEIPAPAESDFPAPSATAIGLPAANPAIMLAASKSRGGGGKKLLLAGSSLLLLGALGAAIWWFFPAQPPALRGEVRLAADGETQAPAVGAAVYLVSREELTARWRDQLAEAQSRAAEIDELLKQANSVHREKVLALELASRTSELADEYNMPDAGELRAARDAAQAEEATALAEVEKLRREKESFTSAAALLKAPPDALDQTLTDESGAFALTLPASTEGLAVFVLAGAGGENPAEAHGWLVPLAGPDEASKPALLSPANALDAEQIREIAGVQP